MDNEIASGHFTEAEAKAFVKRYARGRAIYICVSMHLPLAHDQSRYFPGYQPLRVSLKQALDFMRGILCDVLEDRGGRIKIRVWEKSIFIG